MPDSKIAGSQKYLPHIVGLRGIAVLSVLLFHLDFEYFPGGFTGVDIFFVISGFVITRLIYNETVELKDFDFKNFYIRRARRILPSLIFTLFFSFCLAVFFFSPAHLARFGGALVTAAIGTSNIFFLQESGYFDTASQFKPLLHTWSLGVEIQFYFLSPLVVVYLLKKTNQLTTALILVVGGGISFLLIVLFGHEQSGIIKSLFPSVPERLFFGQGTAFYFTPFRVFEFMFGSIMVWLVQYKIKSRVFQEVLVLIGLVFVLYPVLTYSDRHFFPSYNALLPCIGAAMLIYSGDSVFLGYVLRNRLVFFLGLISYSLYLIHWPLVVFYKYIGDVDLQPDGDKEYPEHISLLSSNAKILLIIISVFFAFLMFKFIETPYRRTRGAGLSRNKKFFKTVAICSLFLICLGSSVWASGGWKFRSHEISPKLAEFINNTEEFHKTEYGGSDFQANMISSDKPSLVFLGDSHVMMYYEGLFQTYGKYHNIIPLGTDGCLFKDDCREEKLREKINELEKYKKKKIIIAQRWDYFDRVKLFFNKSSVPVEQLAGYYAEQIFKIIREIHVYEGDGIAVFGQVPQIVGHDGLIDCLLKPKWLSKNECHSVSVSNLRILQDRKRFNEIFEEKIKENSSGLPRGVKITFLNPFKILCPNDVCLQIKEDQLIYSDDDHLSKFGSRFVIDGFFKKVSKVIPVD